MEQPETTSFRRGIDAHGEKTRQVLLPHEEGDGAGPTGRGTDEGRWRELDQRNDQGV